MISREEQHAFEIEYKSIGAITANSNTDYSVSLFDGLEKGNFKTEAEAIGFVKRKSGVFQKNKQLGLSVRYHKANGKQTHLLFPNSKSPQPFEVSTFYWNQIQVNVDPKERAKRVDQLVPIKVSFNDIARVSAYTNPKKVKIFGGIALAAIIAMFIYELIMMIFMLAPSDSSKILSAATGLPYKSTGAIVTGLLGVSFAFAAIGTVCYPYYKYYKNARDDSGGYSYAGKSWKKQYVDRFYANWIALGLITLSGILIIINNVYVADTMFFTSAIHSFRTWMFVVFLVLTDISIVFIVGIIVWQTTTTLKRTQDFLKAHVDPHDVDLFRAWTTHKRIESKYYIYDYMNNFTFPPTMERLRIISDEIYPKKIRMMDKTKAAKKKDLVDRYEKGLAIYKANIKAHNSKQGI